MADQNFMDLASKTASGITGTDYMMLVNNSEAYKALVNDVAEAILGKLTSKSFSGLETTAKNVIGALNELNSKSVLRLFSDKDKYVKFASATAAKFFIVICSMGTAGINGTPAIAGVISTDYDGKLIDISQINTIDKNSINAEITDGNIIVKYLIDRNATNYLTALVIRFK